MIQSDTQFEGKTWALLFLVIHGVDNRRKLLVYHGALHLQCRSQFAIFDGQILVENRVFLHKSGIADCLLVSILDPLFKILFPNRACLGLRNGLGVRIHRQCDSRQFGVVPFFHFQDNQAAQELLLVSNDHDARQGTHSIQHLGLNRNRGNILTTTRDDQFLESACDSKESALVDLAHVSRMQESLLVNRFFGCFLISEIAHENVSSSNRDFTFAVGILVQNHNFGAFQSLPGRVILEIPRPIHRNRTGCLRSSIKIADSDVDGSEVRQRWLTDRRSARHKQSAAVKSKLRLDCIKHQRLGNGKRKRTRGSVILCLHGGSSNSLGPGRQPAQRSGGFLSSFRHLLVHLFPDSRHAQKDRGSGFHQCIHQGALQCIRRSQVYLESKYRATLDINHIGSHMT
mmetsp:Transcript_3746/g.6726  ORF Transcript_3746/g.6726 Transcript_3746/m.6726 type:complete len:400 (-) Transcript_3746:1-1200(-)